MGPFLDAINNRGCSDDEGGDDELPDSTVAGSGSCRDTNNVDNADQFRESYRRDMWITMQTWWWSTLFWGRKTLLVNVYAVYKGLMEIKGVKLMAQHRFMCLELQIVPTLPSISAAKDNICAQIKTPSDARKEEAKATK